MFQVNYITHFQFHEIVHSQELRTFNIFLAVHIFKKISSALKQCILFEWFYTSNFGALYSLMFGVRQGSVLKVVH